MTGKALGLLVHSLPSRRRHIAKRNIEICFPEKTIAEKQKSFLTTWPKVFYINKSYPQSHPSVLY